MAARTGDGYTGLFAKYEFQGTLLDAREYVQAPLTSALVAGASYQVSFYVSKADDYAWAIGAIGAYLSFAPTRLGIRNSPTHQFGKISATELTK